MRGLESFTGAGAESREFSNSAIERPDFTTEQPFSASFEERDATEKTADVDRPEAEQPFHPDYAEVADDAESLENDFLSRPEDEQPFSPDFMVNESGESAENLDTKIDREKSDLLPRTGGEWNGEAGNSDWKPNDDVVPGNRNGTNPENKTWQEIKDEYGFKSIPFKDGEPDFSEVSKGEVKIDDFTDDRDANFAQADEKMAEQRGCTPEEVEKWRTENKYTWHECRDCMTMQKVPREVHGNISHSGGISEYKAAQKSA